MASRLGSALLATSIVITCWPSLLGSSTPEPDHVETTSRRPTDHIHVSCSDYPSCKLNLGLIRNATISGFSHEACSHAYRSYHCQKTATQSCREQGGIQPNVLAVMKRAYVYAEIHMQEVCHSGSLPDNMITKEGSHCTEFRSCFERVGKFKAAFKIFDYNEACSIASTIHQCAASSLSDCRRRGNLSSEALHIMEGMVEKAWTRMQTSCALTTTTTPPPFHLPATIRCVDFASCPRPDLDVIHLAKRTKDFHEACRITTPYANCIEAAARDCGKGPQLISALALQSMKMAVLKAQSEVEYFCQFHSKPMMDEGILLSDVKPIAGVTTHATRSRPTTSYKKMRCLDIGSCPRPPSLKALHRPSLRGSKEHRIACNTMRDHSACIEHATNDCMGRRLITGAPFESMLRAVQESKDIIKRSCTKRKNFNKDTTGGNTGHTSSPIRLHYYYLVAVWVYVIFDIKVGF